MLFIADRIEQFDYLLQKNHYAYHQAAVQWRRGLYNMSIKSCQKSRNFHLANQSAVKKNIADTPSVFCTNRVSDPGTYVQFFFRSEFSSGADSVWKPRRQILPNLINKLLLYYMSKK